MANLINIVGIGPGTKEYLTPVALKAINNADILVGGQRNLDIFTELNKEKFVLGNNLIDMVEFIKAKRGLQKIAVLASGDPGLFGIISFITKNFDPDEINVIPGISSVQLAFARLRLPWQDAVILSTHGREMDKVIELIANLPKVAVLTDAQGSPSAIARRLTERGITNKKVWVCSNLAYPDEQIIEIALPELAKDVEFSNCLMILMEE